MQIGRIRTTKKLKTQKTGVKTSKPRKDPIVGSVKQRQVQSLSSETAKGERFGKNTQKPRNQRTSQNRRGSTRTGPPEASIINNIEC